MFVRALWYLCVGWWLSGLAIFAAALLTITVIGVPAALMIYNRMPRVLTLRPAGVQVTVTQQYPGQYTTTMSDSTQRPMWMRVIYFVLVGWWASMVVGMVAWLLAVTVVGIPVSLLLLNRLPEVTTLRVN